MTVTDRLRPGTLDEAVFATVAYSDIFDMPLERRQLQRFLIGARADEDDIDASLRRLVTAGRLAMTSDLAYLHGRNQVLTTYADRVPRAKEMWKEAGRWGRRLGRLPFVRGVAVTGGLACDSVADHDDIDYLIITEPGRLWTARLFCMVLVRLARLRHIELCPNYLVADDSLELEERTSYTARELAQMVDIVGQETLDAMRFRNSWLLGHLPNASLRGPTERLERATADRVRQAVESVLRLGVLDRFERWEMRRKIVRIRGVASRRPEVGRPDESSFSPSVCKGHMAGNAAGIEAAWQDRIGRRAAS